MNSSVLLNKFPLNERTSRCRGSHRPEKKILKGIFIKEWRGSRLIDKEGEKNPAE